MTPRKKDVVRKVREWLAYAEEDLRIAQHALTLSSNVPYRLIAFHAQQCVEKCLKAYLVYRGVDFPYTHDIGKLLKWCGNSATWTNKLSNAEELTPFAASARYPGIEKSVTKGKAMRALRIAGHVSRTVQQALIEEGFPLNIRRKE